MPLNDFTNEQLQEELRRREMAKPQYDKIKFEYGPFGEIEAVRILAGGVERGFWSLDGKKLDPGVKPYGYRVTKDNITPGWKVEGYE